MDAMPRATLPLPDKAYLLECFDVDLEAGRLTWRVRPRSHFASAGMWKRFNSQYPGHEAGYLVPLEGGAHRRWYVRMGGRGYHRYRIIFFLANGFVPPEIDHKDRNPLNDGHRNLRAASNSQNQYNKGIHRKKKSGLPKGVSCARGAYCARLNVNKVRVWLGWHATPEAAHAAYCEGAKLHFGEFWCAG